MNIFRVSVLASAAAACAGPAAAQVNVVMTNLDNPRGLAVGPDGGVYVAEAGRGGTGTSIVTGDGATVQFGATGAVSRLLNGAQQRVVTGLPSLAAQAGPMPGAGATGLHDLAFGPTGGLFGVIGLGANPAARATLAADGASFAHLVRLPLGAAHQNVADLGSHEAANNPDAGLLDTNPYGLTRTPAGFAVADAGANALLTFTTATGAVATRAAFAPRANPLPFGPPAYQAVPTTVATGPDGAFYVGELTGFPFPPGAANVHRVDPSTGAQTVAAGGFTNVIDIAVAADGDLYVLQLTTNGVAAAAGPGPGRLVHIDASTGERTTLLESPLFFPGGVAVAPDGTLYVSNLGTSAGGGQVLHLVPEPGACALLAVTAVRLLGRARRRTA
jgi:hypothetical protein